MPTSTFSPISKPAADKPRSGGHLFVPSRWHRPAVLKWLRRTHAWLGMWGAVLGLLFGGTGLLLNHRATMKIPGPTNASTQWQMALPQPLPADIDALTRHLQLELGIDHAPHKKIVDPAGPTPWPGAIQPEHWGIAFATPRITVNADYWAGNQSVTIKRIDPNWLSRLNRLHMATGASAAWILLTDTLAGALIMLSITGLLLWTKLHGPRLLALGLMGTCTTLLVTLALLA
ncbi:MAG: PepSY-associated TM helix domain-containing protein [Comamonas sp.]|uniref:PepSY-associated TM helix domain-containing protein n=1 Tax=Comamonas sp. lk TaxID=2201272 RepID=UPI000EAD6FAD|nr:PepSY-associated TM helix domain-containing protein [Comamonas sp. lk]